MTSTDARLFEGVGASGLSVNAFARSAARLDAKRCILSGAASGTCWSFRIAAVDVQRERPLTITGSCRCATRIGIEVSWASRGGATFRRLPRTPTGALFSSTGANGSRD